MADLNIPSLKVDITADSSQAVAEIGKVGTSAKTLEQNVQSAASGASSSIKSLTDSMTDVGKKMSLTVTAPIVAALTACVSGASDLNETLSKTSVVFGDYYEQVIAWSEDAVESMGLAQATALEMASTYGDMATGMGLSGSAAANMSMNLTQLAADLASFKNISADVAGQKLQAIFTGETEGLKSLGIIMNETNLAAYALANGYSKAYGEMSQAEKVALRYAYVMDACKNANGDFARTGDSLANRMKKIKESIKELANGFGSLLVDSVSSVVGTLQGIVSWLNGLDEGAKKAILTTALVVASIGPLLLAIGKVSAAVKGLQATLVSNPWTLAIAGAIMAITGIVAAVSALDAKAKPTADTVERLENAVDKGAKGKLNMDASEIDTASGKIDDIDTALSNLDAGGTLTLDLSDPSDCKAYLEYLNNHSEVDGRITFTTTSQQAITDYITATKQLPDGVEFTATGRFTVTDWGTDAINGYAEAIAAAASATGDYADAVAAMNAIVDDEASRQIAEINNQLGEDMQSLVAQVNAGTLDPEEARAQADALVEAAVADKNAILEVADAQKLANDVFANGTAADDGGAMFDMYYDLFGDSAQVQSGTAERSRQRMANATDTDTGEFTAYTGSDLDVANAMLDVETRTTEAINGAAEAQQTLNEAMADADTREQENNALYETKIAMYDSINSIIAEYVRLTSDVWDEDQQIWRSPDMSAAEAWSKACEQYADDAEVIAVANEMMMVGSNGTPMYYGTSASQFINAGDQGKSDAEDAFQREAEAIEQARTDATNEFGAALEQINADYNATEMAATISMIEAAGGSVSDTAKQLNEEGIHAFEAAVTQINNGSKLVPEAVENAFSTIDSLSTEAKSGGNEIGKNMTAGMREGILNAAEMEKLKSAARKMVRETMNAAKEEADTHSPSKKMRDEVGVMLTRGMSVGIEEEAPSAVRAMKRATSGVISGASEMVRTGGAMTSVANALSGGGINYEALAEAVSRRPIAFGVSARGFTRAVATESSSANNERAAIVAAGYGRG